MVFKKKEINNNKWDYVRKQTFLHIDTNWITTINAHEFICFLLHFKFIELDDGKMAWPRTIYKTMHHQARNLQPIHAFMVVNSIHTENSKSSKMAIALFLEWRLPLFVANSSGRFDFHLLFLLAAGIDFFRKLLKPRTR